MLDGVFRAPAEASDDQGITKELEQSWRAAEAPALLPKWVERRLLDLRSKYYEKWPQSHRPGNDSNEYSEGGAPA